MKTNPYRRRNGPSPRSLARSIAAVRSDSLASGTDAISIAQIDREVAAVRMRRKRATVKR